MIQKSSYARTKDANESSFSFSLILKANSLAIIFISSAERSVWLSKKPHSRGVVLHNLSSYQSNVDFWILVVDIDYQEKDESSSAFAVQNVSIFFMSRDVPRVIITIVFQCSNMGTLITFFFFLLFAKKL